MLASVESFAVETTLTGNTELSLVKAASQAGYKTNLAYVGLRDTRLSIVRVRERVLAGGHDVPERDLHRRFERSLAHLKVGLGLFDRAFILDNSAKRFRLLIKIEGGTKTYVATSLPTWIAGI